MYFYFCPYRAKLHCLQDTQGVALGYEKHWAFSPLMLNPKLQLNNITCFAKSVIKVITSVNNLPALTENNRIFVAYNKKHNIMKKVIVISTSLRVGSNSDMLADQFVEGAKAAGNDVEKITLAGKTISFCKGCLACQKLGKCVIKDDVNDIMQKILEADVVCWATPIYYYEMSGQMKTLIDRMNAMYSLDYKFRDIYLLTTAAEDEPDVPRQDSQVG